MLFAKARITSILLNGVLGYSVLQFFFVIFRAPDLALTQLVVESVTTALFLISFYVFTRLEERKCTAEKMCFQMQLFLSVLDVIVVLDWSIRNEL